MWSNEALPTFALTWNRTQWALWREVGSETATSWTCSSLLLLQRPQGSDSLGYFSFKLVRSLANHDRKTSVKLKQLCWAKIPLAAILTALLLRYTLAPVGCLWHFNLGFNGVAINWIPSDFINHSFCANVAHVNFLGPSLLGHLVSLLARLRLHFIDAHLNHKISRIELIDYFNVLLSFELMASSSSSCTKLPTILYIIHKNWCDHLSQLF